MSDRAPESTASLAPASPATERFGDDAGFLVGLVRRELRQVITPALASADARWAAVIADRLLGVVERRFAADDLLRDEAAAVAGAAGDLGVEVPAALREDPGGTLAELAAAADTLVDRPGAWTTLIALAEAQDRCELGGIVTSTDESYREAGVGVAAGSGTDEAPQGAPLTPARLTAYVQEHLPGHEHCTATSIERAGSGTSKEILFVELEDGEQRSSWVLRRDMPFSSQRVTVVDEYPLLCYLHESGFPVPRPLWLETDPARLGQPVFATARVAGDSDVAAWQADEARAERIVAHAAGVLARLHAIDPDRAPTPRQPLPGTVGETALDRVEHLYAYWQDIARGPDPLVEACFAWLRRNAPDRRSRRSIVHGDFGLHNLLVAGDEVSAVLDWEFARIGDSHEDLAYVRPFLERMGRWNDFRSHYEQQGGVAFDARLEHYFRVLVTFRLALGSFAAMRAIRDHDERISLRKANSGQMYARRLLIDAARLIAESGGTPADQSPTEERR